MKNTLSWPGKQNTLCGVCDGKRVNGNRGFHLWTTPSTSGSKSIRLPEASNLERSTVTFMPSQVSIRAIACGERMKRYSFYERE